MMHLGFYFFFHHLPLTQIEEVPTVLYIRHENLSNGTQTFKPDARGSELADCRLCCFLILPHILTGYIQM